MNHIMIKHPKIQLTGGLLTALIVAPLRLTLHRIRVQRSMTSTELQFVIDLIRFLRIFAILQTSSSSSSQPSTFLIHILVILLVGIFIIIILFVIIVVFIVSTVERWTPSELRRHPSLWTQIEMRRHGWMLIARFGVGSLPINENKYIILFEFENI